MKRLSLLGFVGVLASVLAGCPIFSGNGGESCAGQCFSGTAPGCFKPGDCGQNETCGADSQCHSGDCTVEDTGCVQGYTCQVDPSTDTASCVPNGSGTGSGGTGGSGTGGSGTGGAGTGGAGTGGAGTGGAGTGGGASAVYCGHPADCSAGQTCAPNGTCEAGDCNANGCIFGYTCGADGTCTGAANACDSDGDCAANGGSCIAGSNMNGGVCTQPGDQCFDQSQCNTGDNCVAGKCVVACASDASCRDGSACDLALGICTNVVKACAITNDCGGPNTVCVGGACVPRSVGGTCGAGDVWDENGCVPNQAATFTCQTEGVRDVCAAGSICLHHDCWISCDPPNQNACSGSGTWPDCKPVEADGAMYAVCGSDQNLGSECGAGAMNQACPGSDICIDGFCK